MSKLTQRRDAGILCRICLRPVERQPQGRGRKREYHRDCRRIAGLLQWLHDTITRDGDSDRPRLTGEAARRLRSELWAIGNRLSIPPTPNGESPRANEL